MTYPNQLIDVSVRNHVAWVALNRPERLNAMNEELLLELGEVLALTERDEDVRVLVIRGAGRAFSSGYDIERKSSSTEVAEQDVVADYDRLLSRINLYFRIWDHPKPVIAAVHGYCLAGATQLAIFADLTIVTEDAKIGVPTIPIGGGYITPIWATLVGPKRAKQLSFMPGATISGKVAADWGWANYAVPEADFWDEVERTAEYIARVPGPILRMKKASINRAMDVQGFRTIAPMGAETDALLHASDAVGELRQLVREHGLKEAIAIFKSGQR